MNQRIDFYREILKIRNIPLPFNVMKKFVYGLCIFMVISTIILIVVQIKNEHDLQNLEKKQSSTLSQLQLKESKMTSKANRDQVVAQLELNDKLYDKNKQMLEELEKIFKSGSGGFSKYLISLSKSVPQGLWLTKIELLDYGKQFSLYGKAIDPKLITTFISSLNTEDPFKGKVLNLFDVVYKKGDSVLEFKIKTESEDSS